MMRKPLIFGLLSSGIIFMNSCSKGDSSGGTNNSADSIFVSLSSPTVEYNEFDYVTVSVKDRAGNDITSSCSLLSNSNTAISSKFTPSSMGTYNISAKKGASPSNTVTLKTTAASPSPFSQKILVEDCTGAWCGYCPRVAFLLEDYKATHPNCISLAVHGGSSGTDPYKFQFYPNFNTHFQIQGYPTGILNRTSEWSEDPVDLDAALEKWAPLGISISSAVNGSNITGSAKVKFNVSTVKPMKIVIALVENGLVYPQTNYYSPTYGGNPINNFVHNCVLRKTSTDLFGDAIPVSAETKNNIWELPFSFPMTGNTYTDTYSVNPANCAIIAFVMDGSTAELGTYNVQYAPVGNTVDFD
jgi:hypothetical protein